jgi:hypothetical protein
MNQNPSISSHGCTRGHNKVHILENLFERHGQQVFARVLQKGQRHAEEPVDPLHPEDVHDPIGRRKRELKRKKKEKKRKKQRKDYFTQEKEV